MPTNGVSDWSQQHTQVSDGNEIANHSKSHPDLTKKVTASEKMDVIRSAKTLIDQEVYNIFTVIFENIVVRVFFNHGSLAY